MISNLTWKGRCAESHVFITESPVGKLATGSAVDVTKPVLCLQASRSAQDSKFAVQGGLHRINLRVSTV